MEDKILPYKFIGDVVYPMQPWFYSLFKSEKDGLSRYNARWNLIQSSTRMLVEKQFGMLKGRFIILLKRVDTCLVGNNITKSVITCSKSSTKAHITDLVTACICLNNMSIANSNGFNMY
jgi:hypothetical protein